MKPPSNTPSSTTATASGGSFGPLRAIQTRRSRALRPRYFPSPAAL